MSIETKIVADFYARLFPLIDHRQDVLVCRDDGGAGADAIADLCFHFLNASDQYRLEFKTLKKGKIIDCTTKQVATWQGPTARAPHAWVAIEDGASYLFWRHDDPAFVVNFAAGKPTSNRRHFDVLVPNSRRLTLLALLPRIYAARA